MSDLVKKTSGAGELMELASVAELLVKSSYCGVKKPEDALWIIATGHSLGIDPITSLRGIHVISGKPVLSADLMSAVAMRHPDCLHLQVVEMTPEHAVVSVQRRGWPKATSVSFSIEDARAAGLLNNPTWKKYPADMCKARALARAVRIAFPDALLGIYVEGELDEPAQAAPLPRSPEASARFIEEAELVEDEPAASPIDYSKDTDWEAANRSYRHLIGELGWSKVDEQRVHEWVKHTAQVQSSKEINPQRLLRLCERLRAFDVEGRAEWLRNAIEKRGQ
jgi:hypothetical protein